MDTTFYRFPKLVYHIDEGAVAALTRYYDAAVPGGAEVRRRTERPPACLRRTPPHNPSRRDVPRAPAARAAPRALRHARRACRGRRPVVLPPLA